MLPLLLAIVAAPALAGDIVVRTDVAADLYLGTAMITRTWGPASVRVTGMQPGLAGLKVVRGDKSNLVDVLVPDDGAALVTIAADGIATRPLEADPDASGPVLELRAAVGQRFAVVLDGTRLATVGDRYPLRVEALQPGPHHLELRTADLTVVWTRADLELIDDDLLIVTGQEGYAPLVSGRPDAFRLAGAATGRPPAGTGAGG